MKSKQKQRACHTNTSSRQSPKPYTSNQVATLKHFELVLVLSQDEIKCIKILLVKMLVQREIRMEPGKAKRADTPIFSWVETSQTPLMSKEGSAKLSGSSWAKVNWQRSLCLLEQHALVSSACSVIVGERPLRSKIHSGFRTVGAGALGQLLHSVGRSMKHSLRANAPLLHRNLKVCTYTINLEPHIQLFPAFYLTHVQTISSTSFLTPLQ